MAKAVTEEYTSSLADLTVNSKPLINMLTMLADDYLEHAPSIVRAVEAHLQKVPGEIKLPVLYLIDSIVKNVGKEYVSLFTQNIVSTFCSVFEQVDEKIRAQMFKLRQTWNEVFPPKKLYALDARVNAIDPAWPITANPPHSRIHLNPKFLSPTPPASFPTPEATQTIADSAVREELLKKQKELIELQKKKVELELLQTKAILEEQQKILENQTAGFNPETPIVKPKLKTENPEPFPAVSNKNFVEGSRDNKAAFESSRVRDPRLRLKRINNKRPVTSTLNLPEKDKPNKSNLFGSTNTNDNLNIDSSGLVSSVKKNERGDRRSEKKHKKYKEHKNRPKIFPVTLPILETVRPKSANNDTTKPIDFIQTPNESMSESNPAEKKVGSAISRENENKLDENEKSKSKSSPSKNRSRNKTKEKLKKKTDSPLKVAFCKEEETSKIHSSEPETCISLVKINEEIPELFGEEDVDLRKLPPLTPPTPPPPIISNNLETISDVETTNGWANIKRSSTDNSSPIKSKKMKSSHTWSKPVMLNNLEDEDEGNSLNFPEQESDGRSLSLCDIMGQAEEQLTNGTITFTQYNQVLKGVMTMNEESKLKMAMKIDRGKEMIDLMEVLDSPGDASASCDNSDLVEKEESCSNLNMDEDMKLLGSGCDENNDEQIDSVKSASDIMMSAFSEHGDVNLRKRAHFKEQFHRGGGKEPRHRYFNTEPYFPGSNKTWMMRPPPPSFAHRPPRKELMFNRWPYPNYNRAPFDAKPINFGQPSRMRNIRHPHDLSLPPADPNVLEMIKNDPMTYVSVGGVSREIRFYGENAIIMLDWEDPRDLMFQPGSRRVFIDGVDVLSLQFNSQYREITLADGVRISIRLGAPTRELFIDGRFHDVKFGGAPVEINLGGRTHLVQLEGPLPFLKIGPTKRTDLVAGKVNLIVDGKIDNMFPIYLDAKPQRFEIGNLPFIIRFVEALQTVVINGHPFKIQFGGLPVPIFFRGEKHFLRLTSLPPGITPGYVNILNMEGGRLSTTPPPRTPPPPQINGFEPTVIPPSFIKQTMSGEIQQGIVRPVIPAPYFSSDYQLYNSPPGTDQPVDVLTSLISAPSIPNFSQVPSQNYVVEPSQENVPTTSVPMSASQPDINVSELLKKLVAIGVVPPVKEKENVESRLAVKPVDFSKPETLKVKQQGLINRLYSGIQCSSCGVRFAPEQTLKHSQHLDWHFRQNRRERHSSKIALSRKWNYDVSDWIQYQEIEDVEDRAQSWFEIQDKKTDGNEREEKEEPSVSAKGYGENPCCTVCRDKFDQFFNEEKEEWQLKLALCVEDKLYHPLCYKDEQENKGKNVGEMLITIQEELQSIETIVIDDTIACESDAVLTEEKFIVNDIDAIKEDISMEIDDPIKEDNSINENDFVEENETLTMLVDVSNQGIKEPIEAIDNEIKDQSTENEIVSMVVDEHVQETAEENNTTEASDSSLFHEDSDDDILEMKVIKPNIESYEILDDEDEIDEPNDQLPEIEDDLKERSEEMDLSDHENEEVISNVIIKQEKIDMVSLVGNPSHVTETVSIDGNSEFSAPTVILPKKIIINISSIVPKNTSEDSPADQQLTTSDESTKPEEVAFNSEPLPPGEEMYPASVKPKLAGKNFIEMGVVNKGKELSGLCSIM